MAEKRSALRWPEALRAPLLVLHGGQDRQISPLQSLRLATRLEELGREYELHVYAGEGHTLAGRAAARDEEVIVWFRRHMSPAPGTPAPAH